jgi:hypothetical protein
VRWGAVLAGKQQNSKQRRLKKTLLSNKSDFSFPNHKFSLNNDYDIQATRAIAIIIAIM